MQFCVHLFSKEMGLTHLRGYIFRHQIQHVHIGLMLEEYYQQCVHNVLYEIEGFTSLTEEEEESTSREYISKRG